MTKFKYHVFPDRTYTLEYGDMTYEVLGSEIMAMFRRQARLEEFFK